MQDRNGIVNLIVSTRVKGDHVYLDKVPAYEDNRIVMEWVY